MCDTAWFAPYIEERPVPAKVTTHQLFLSIQMTQSGRNSQKIESDRDESSVKKVIFVSMTDQLSEVVQKWALLSLFDWPFSGVSH